MAIERALIVQRTYWRRRTYTHVETPQLFDVICLGQVRPTECIREEKKYKERISKQKWEDETPAKSRLVVFANVC
jgi:hypothetical protein